MPYKEPEIQKQYDKEKYQRNRARILGLRKARHERNKEVENSYMSAYQKANRKDINEYHRNWRRNQPPEKKVAEYETMKRWRKNNPKKVSASTLRYQKKNPAKAVAQIAVAAAIRFGLIVRPNQCSKCGKICIPQGHHTDYSKILEVVWLCVKCHKQIHLSQDYEKIEMSA